MVGDEDAPNVTRSVTAAIYVFWTAVATNLHMRASVCVCVVWVCVCVCGCVCVCMCVCVCFCVCVCVRVRVRVLLFRALAGNMFQCLLELLELGFIMATMGGSEQFVIKESS